MTGDNLTVLESEDNYIPEGATLTVTQDSTNQFTGRRVLSVETDADIDHLGGFQMYQLEDNKWREIVVGRESDTLIVE